MKWLKTYEELDPRTYRNAANKLSNWNKSKRSYKLEDWADESEYGIYNMHTAKQYRKDSFTLKEKNSKFTMPTLIGVYYGYDPGSELPVNLLKPPYGSNREDNIEKYSNKMVQDWENGDAPQLSIMLEFGLKPTKETTTKDGKELQPSREEFNWKDKRRYLGSVYPMFRINIVLTEEAYGMDDWYGYSKEEAERAGEYWKEPTIQEFYSDAKWEHLNISRPFTDGYFGIFSDRKSAIKFKNYFLSIINGENSQLNGLDIKSIIMDVLSLVGGESSDIERIMNKIKSIRIHGLYDDELSDKEGRYSRRWFGHPGVDVKPWGKTIN
jgi:hypothetical protein